MIDERQMEEEVLEDLYARWIARAVTETCEEFYDIL